MSWFGGFGGPEAYGGWGYPDWSNSSWGPTDGLGCGGAAARRSGPYGSACGGAACGGCCAKGGCGKGGPSWGPGAAIGNDEKEELVSAVKQIQRSTTEGRAQWEKYSDALRTGSRDPGRHSMESLQNFLTAYRQGVAPEDFAAKAGGGRVLRLRGVPFQCGLSDVVHFLAEYGITQAEVAMGRRPDGRVTGEAFAMFASSEVAERALDERQRQEIQGRYIELFRSTDQEWREANAASPAGQASSGDPEKDRLVARVKEIQRSGQEAKDQWYRFCDATRTGNRDPVRHTVESLRGFLNAFDRGEAPEVPATARASTVLRLRGVPFQSELRDVVDFLGEYGVPESHVTLARSPEGRKTGEAYAVFPSVDLADRAMEEKQRHEIKGRYIELFRSSFEERDQAMVQAAAAVAASSQALAQRGPQGEGYGFSEKDELVARIKSIQRSGHEGRERWERYCDAARTGNRDPALHNLESMRSFLQAYERGEEPEVPAKKAMGGSDVLRLRGVPFQSDILDVVEFLKEFGVDKTQVALGRGADGRVTGEAYATFRSVELAEQALDAKQHQEIRGRYIELFRSSGEEKAQHTSAALAIGSSTGDREKDELVARVKQIQRSRQDGKEMWEDYCTSMKTGNRDPVRHTVESIRNFVDAYDRGETAKVCVDFGGPVLRLRGVPFQSDVSDVAGFLAAYDVDRDSVAFGRGPDGRKTGEAFVIFRSNELAEIALEEKQKQEIHGRYIELFRSSYEERELNCQPPATSEGSQQWGSSEKDELVGQVKAVQRSGTQGREQWERYCDAMRTGNRDPLKHTSESMRNFLEAYRRGESPETLAVKVVGASRVVRLRGVPFQSAPQDIQDFLLEYGVDSSKVALTRGADGRPTGEAFVVFPTPELAEKAMDEKQKQEIRGRYIELFRSTVEERDECLAASPGGGYGGGGGGGGGGGTMAPQFPLNSPTLKLRGLPFGCKVQDVTEFLSEYFVDVSQVVLCMGADGKSTGEAFVACSTKELSQIILREKHMQKLGKRYVEVFESNFDECAEALKAAESLRPQRSRPAQDWTEGSFAGPWGPKGCCGKGMAWGGWDGMEGMAGKGACWKGCFGKQGPYGAMCGKGSDYGYGPTFGPCGKGGCGPMDGSCGKGGYWEDGPYGKGGYWDDGYGSSCGSCGMAGKGGPAQFWGLGGCGGTSSSKGCGGAGEGDYGCGGPMDGSWMKGGPFGKGGAGSSGGVPAAFGPRRGACCGKGCAGGEEGGACGEGWHMPGCGGMGQGMSWSGGDAEGGMGHGMGWSGGDAEGGMGQGMGWSGPGMEGATMGDASGKGGGSNGFAGVAAQEAIEPWAGMGAESGWSFPGAASGVPDNFAAFAAKGWGPCAAAQGGTWGCKG